MALFFTSSLESCENKVQNENVVTTIRAVVSLGVVRAGLMDEKLPVGDHRDSIPANRGGCTPYVVRVSNW